MTVDQQLFRQTMAQWASGVSIVTTTLNGEYQGMTANSFTSVSLEPLLILICIGKHLYTHVVIEQSGIFAVNILKRSQVDWGKLFAGMYPDVIDRFEGIKVISAVTGAPILPDVLGWLDCRVYRAYDGGDHTIFVGEVVAAAAFNGEEPLTYFNRTWGSFTPIVQETD